jgi:hypothetical protein
MREWFYHRAMGRMWLALGFVAVAACASAREDAIDGPIGDDDVVDAPPGPPDAAPDANMCPNQPCDILTECGCGAAQACDVDTSDLMGGACRAVTFPGHEIDTCTTLDDCDSGYVCIGGGGNSSCKKYCATNADCSPPRGQCVIDITDGTNPIPGVPPVCSSNCDPAGSPAGFCPTGWKCGLFTQTHLGTDFNIADCTVAGGGGQGGNCKVGATGDDSLCASNFLCTTIDAGTNFNCRRICTIGGGQCGGLTCLQFNPPFTLGGTEYGVCN